MGSRRTHTVDAVDRKRREGWLQRCPLSYDLAHCIHPPFVECYAIQAFSIASDFDPKLMPKRQNQITMRKVCIVIQSLLSYRPNHHSDREKRYTLLTLNRRKNVVNDVTNVEQHELLGFDASRPLNSTPKNMIPKRANSLAVVGVISRFFQTTAAASEIRHVCQARFEVQAKKGQRVPCKSPGERELGVVQEARFWRPIPVREDLLHSPAAPLAKRVRSRIHH